MASPILIVADPPAIPGFRENFSDPRKEKEWAAGKKGKGRGKPIGSADGKAEMRRSVGSVQNADHVLWPALFLQSKSNAKYG